MNIDTSVVIDFIVSTQNTDGSFDTYELYPVTRPDQDWQKLPDSSPFITANIIYSLLQTDNPKAHECAQKAARHLLTLTEHKAYWRFWPSKSYQHPIPIDTDDTSICSFVLSKLGYTIDNKKILTHNKNNKGYFKTWVTPNLKTFCSHPILSLHFLMDCIKALPTYFVKYLTYADCEPAVAANVLLYLGSKNNQLCIHQIIEQVRNNNMRLQYYYDEIMVYYHIARAYENGVSEFSVLAQTAAERIEKRWNENSLQNNILLQLMSANVLLSFKYNIQLAEQLVYAAQNSTSYPNKWQCLAYFSSENRNFLAGSPEFTAAQFAEAATKLNRLKDQG